MTVPSQIDFERLYVFGCGGSGRELASLAEQTWGSSIEIIFLVDQRQYLLDAVNGFPACLLSESECMRSARFLVALGDPAMRRKAVAACESAGHLPASLVHPRADISRWVEIGQGAVIYPGVVITTNVAIGAHAQINVGCTISHDVSIGAFSTLSPGAHIAGHVQIGQDVFIGTGASIINGSAETPMSIGDGAVIAAGACVTKSVEPDAMVAGVPAVRKR